jgi:uncharacterized membrane protein
MEFAPFIFVSVVFIVFGIALGFFSPKKKIWWYGYRTPQSMKSDESYVYANRISGRIMIILGLIISGASLFLETHINGLIIIAGVVVLLVVTELKLYRFHKKNLF